MEGAPGLNSFRRRRVFNEEQTALNLTVGNAAAAACHGAGAEAAEAVACPGGALLAAAAAAAAREGLDSKICWLALDSLRDCWSHWSTVHSAGGQGRLERASGSCSGRLRLRAFRVQGPPPAPVCIACHPRWSPVAVALRTGRLLPTCFAWFGLSLSSCWCHQRLAASRAAAQPPSPSPVGGR